MYSGVQLYTHWTCASQKKLYSECMCVGPIKSIILVYIYGVCHQYHWSVVCTFTQHNNILLCPFDCSGYSHHVKSPVWMEMFEHISFDMAAPFVKYWVDWGDAGWLVVTNHHHKVSGHFAYILCTYYLYMNVFYLCMYVERWMPGLSPYRRRRYVRPHPRGILGYRKVRQMRNLAVFLKSNNRHLPDLPVVYLVSL